MKLIKYLEIAILALITSLIITAFSYCFHYLEKELLETVPTNKYKSHKGATVLTIKSI